MRRDEDVTGHPSATRVVRPRWSCVQLTPPVPWGVWGDPYRQGTVTLCLPSLGDPLVGTPLGVAGETSPGGLSYRPGLDRGPPRRTLRQRGSEVPGSEDPLVPSPPVETLGRS